MASTCSLTIGGSSPTPPMSMWMPLTLFLLMPLTLFLLLFPRSLSPSPSPSPSPLLAGHIFAIG